MAGTQRERTFPCSLGTSNIGQMRTFGNGTTNYRSPAKATIEVRKDLLYHFPIRPERIVPHLTTRNDARQQKIGGMKELALVPCYLPHRTPLRGVFAGDFTLDLSDADG